MKPPGWYIDGPRKSLKTVSLSPKLLAALDGCLLGDGSYIQQSMHSASFSLGQCVGHTDWIYSLKKLFDDEHVGNNMKIYDQRNEVKIWTYSYIEFVSERQRWYPNGKKIVPENINLSDPVILANWHMGDGNVSTPRGRLEVKLHTNGFTEKDVQLLSDKFDDIGIHNFINHWRGQPILVLQHKNAARFLDMIRPLMVPCFEYKAPADPWVPPLCKKCGGPLSDRFASQRYAKYCDNCVSHKMKKFRSLSRMELDLINNRKRITRWRREGKLDGAKSADITRRRINKSTPISNFSSNRFN